MSESPNPKVQKSLYHLEDKNLNQLNLITKSFFRVDLAIESRHPNTRKALEALSANVLIYLNPERTHLLVAVKPSELSESP